MKEKSKEILDFIAQMNHLWTFESKASDLKKYFHPNMIAIVPNIRDRIIGSAACVKGWSDFSQNFKTTKWLEKDHIVNFYCNNTVAVASYDFEMSFEGNGQKISMEGRDMFTLVKENGKWLVVSDQFSQRP